LIIQRIHRSRKERSGAGNQAFNKKFNADFITKFTQKEETGMEDGSDAELRDFIRVLYVLHGLCGE